MLRQGRGACEILSDWLYAPAGDKHLCVGRVTEVGAALVIFGHPPDFVLAVTAVMCGLPIPDLLELLLWASMAFLFPQSPETQSSSFCLAGGPDAGLSCCLWSAPDMSPCGYSHEA